MALEVVPLKDIIEKHGEDSAQNILDTFESIIVSGKETAHDVEFFLKKKAIEFTKSGISATHLIFAPFKGKSILVGYFSIANKPLVIPSRHHKKLSNRIRSKIRRGGGVTEDKSTIVYGYLIGQIGKNYSESCKKANAISGKDILQSAYDHIKKASDITGGSIVYLEFEDVQYLHDLYSDFGFATLENYSTKNNLKLAVMRLI